MSEIDLMWTCPICGARNEDGWILEVDGKLQEGVCQQCWEGTDEWAGALEENWENEDQQGCYNPEK